MVLESKVAQNLIVAQVCFFFVHTLMYMLPLKLWNSFSFEYMLMYVAEEIPNTFNFIICLSALIDQLIPEYIHIRGDQIQRTFYYWKPIVNLVALLALII